MSISNAGYGKYTLKGLGISVHITDSDIWDWCDDNGNIKKHNNARRKAFQYLANNL